MITGEEQKGRSPQPLRDVLAGTTLRDGAEEAGHEEELPPLGKMEQAVSDFTEASAGAVAALLKRLTRFRSRRH